VIGQTFCHYQVMERIGSGGMGEVYRARDTKLGRDVALKVLPEAFARNAERMARFRREAQVLASLNHLNIATIYGLEESNGDCALVMELVEGPTLAERIAGTQPLTRPASGVARSRLGREAGGVVHLGVYSASDRHVTQLEGWTAEGQFSPDGKWIAYQKGEVGRGKADIFAQPFPGPGGRIQVSSEGGAQPRWSRDGKRVFYIQPDRKLMVVSLDPRTGTASAPRMVFQTRIIAPSYAFLQYDVSPDGRFLINSFPSNSSSPLTLLTRWTALVKGPST
jgi:hypothetical protein